MCPVSPPYSLVSKDFGKLGYVIGLLTPGLVFADDATPFAERSAPRCRPASRSSASRGAIEGRNVTSLAALLASPDHPTLDYARTKRSSPDTIAKFLLTSGSTGNPKAVINTQRMLCANQVMIREAMAFLKDEPPVIVDWLPWNHTFGGNHNIGLTLFNGGSMYLDEGKPTPAGIAETIRNLREIAPTVYFNVPKGYESLLPVLRDDAELRKNFFSRLHAMFFSGASLSAHVWNGLDEVVGAGDRRAGADADGPRLHRDRAVLHVGDAADLAAPAMSGCRCRATRPSWCRTTASWKSASRGPNVTPGYWRQPELTAKAFDEEGYYKLGDALKPANPDDFAEGFDFDGRISEDFKLASGTWVSVGPLRAKFIAACAPLVRDVVIAGLDRDEISALVVLDLDGCKLINATLPLDDLATIAADPLIRDAFRERLRQVPDAGHRLLDPHHPRGAARRAAVDRPRRSHRQGLGQPARRAGASRASDRGSVCRTAARARHRGGVGVTR